MLVTLDFRSQLFVPNLPISIKRSATNRAAGSPSFIDKSKARSATVSAGEAPITFPRGGGRDGGEGDNSLLLPFGLRREALPKHVAVIMDGNGRWAASRGLPAASGHIAGYKALKLMVELSCRWGIRVLTVFAFSSENWLRPKPEFDFLMMLFENVLKEDLRDLLREGIRICIIGDSSKLPKTLQKMCTEVEEISHRNSRLDLVVALSYSGRADIVQACQKIAHNVKKGILNPEDITESCVAQELETSNAVGCHYPDLLIRTSGELRLSNFLLWELAYTELFFSQSHWPDFGEDEYVEALQAFQKRQRRFGLRTTS